jgi:hypothetical protein
VALEQATLTHKLDGEERGGGIDKNGGMGGNRRKRSLTLKKAKTHNKKNI